jgi:hypothetical protein
MIQQSLLDIAPLAPDQERLRLHEADLTPVCVALVGAARALREWLAPGPPFGGHLTPPLEVLIPCAGHGVFVQAIRALAPLLLSRRVQITAVDLRVELLPALDQLADSTILGDATTLAANASSFSLAIDNPGFTLIPELIGHLPSLMRPEGRIVFLAHTGLGQRSTKRSWMAQHCPIEQWRVRGDVSYRDDQINPRTGQPYEADQRDYSFWCWSAHPAHLARPGSSWYCLDLPVLPRPLRRWSRSPDGQPRRPGTHGWELTVQGGTLALLWHDDPKHTVVHPDALPFLLTHNPNATSPTP